MVELPAEARTPVLGTEGRGVRDSGPSRASRDDAACKGALVVGLVDHVEDTLGEAGAMAWRAALDPVTRAKIDGVILPMAWLPVQVLEDLVHALGADGDTARLTTSGRAVAAREMSTTHRLFLQTASPASVLERIPHLHRLYFSRGDVKVIAVPSGARIDLEGTHLESVALVQWLAAFWQEVLELAGARDVKVAATSARGRGDERSSVTLRWR
jgi:hypothetical protein